MLSAVRVNIFARASVVYRSLLRRDKSTVHCLDSWTIPIRSTGFALVDTHYTTYIKPLHPSEYVEKEDLIFHEYPDSTKASARVSLYLSLPENTDVAVDEESFVQEFTKDISYNPQVNIERRRHFLEVKAKPQRKFSFPPEDISITIEVPTQFNLQINASDNAAVHVSDLEGCWRCEVTTDKGNCYLSNIKGMDIHAKSSSGNIISESQLLAELGTLEVENAGTISVHKLQGRKFYLDSDSGSIKTGALYLQRGEVSSQTGDVVLGDIHGIFEVKLGKGDISVGSVSGDLHAVTDEGNINLHLAQPKHIDLKTKNGDISVATEKETEPTAINLKAQDIIFDPNLKIDLEKEDKGANFTVISAKINTDETELINCPNYLKAEAKLGTFKMEVKDWFSSLKLNKKQ